MLMFCQGMMMLEIAHAVFGLVKSGIMAPALQVDYSNIYLVTEGLSVLSHDIPRAHKNGD